MYHLGRPYINNIPGFQLVSDIIQGPIPGFAYYDRIAGTPLVQIPDTTNIDLTLSASITARSGTFDFGDTVQLSEIQVTDANGQPLSGITLTDPYGNTIPTNQSLISAVPEPGSFTCLVGGLIILSLLRR